MKCTNCDHDNQGGSRFCQNCGTPLPFRQFFLPEQVLLFLKDSLFLAVCILYSVSLGFSFLHGGLPIISILMTIFLWLLYSQGRAGLAAPNYIRCISGTVFAYYVVQWVAYCAFALSGFLLLVLGSFMDTTGLWQAIYPEIRSYLGGYTRFFTSVTTIFLMVFSVVLIMIAIVGICFNIFGMRSIHRFIQSVYQSLASGQTRLIKCDTARIWLMVFGVLRAVSALSGLFTKNMSSFISEGSAAAAMILGSILVGKYFVKFE